MIVKQLGQTENSYTPASVIRSDGNISSLNRNREYKVAEAQDLALTSNSIKTQAAQKDAMFENPEQFVESLMPIAERVAEKYGMDPKAIISQAAVETGWGKFVIHKADGSSSHNLFGIKANKGWQGEQAVVDTLEFNNGLPQKQKAAFRSYGSVEEAMDDYGRFITSQPRYSHAVENASNAARYTSALQEAGYATDPEYASKIMAVYNSERLNTLMP